jgi:hypothetical protein
MNKTFFVFLVHDILLCLKYNIKMNVLCLSQLSFIVLFQMLATTSSFSLNMPIFIRNLKSWCIFFWLQLYSFGYILYHSICIPIVIYFYCYVFYYYVTCSFAGLNILSVMYVPFSVLCVLFVCKCVLYCCIVCKCVLYCCIVCTVSV